MTKIRLQFSKGGPLRFIGHLNFLKVFQQTISRAKLPVAYSQGFNPHMQLSFALPLPLGMTSIHDYADITLESEMQPDEIILRLNTHGPEGLVLAGAQEFTGPGAAALVMAADYTFPVEILEDYAASTGKSANEIIQTLLGRESIIIPKKTKSGIKDTEIRPDILDISIKPQYVNMRLAAGSARFLNPLIVAGLLLNCDADASTITRAELYRQATDSPEWIPLNETPVN